jgi:hypothetical protein
MVCADLGARASLDQAQSVPTPTYPYGLHSGVIQTIYSAEMLIMLMCGVSFPNFKGGLLVRFGGVAAEYASTVPAAETVGSL